MPPPQTLTWHSLEVRYQVDALLAQLSKVRDPASPLEQQEVVEGLKDLNAGLVDGHQHGTVGVADVSHGAHDDGSGAGVQT